jgi:hypothetical protein
MTRVILSRNDGGGSPSDGTVCAHRQGVPRSARDDTFVVRFRACCSALWPFGRRWNLPERRRRTRYLTLKNAAFAAVALAFAFLLLSFWSAWRPAHSGRSLFESRASDAPVVSREPYAVVEEGSIRDYPEARLVEPAAPVPPAPRAEPQLRKGQGITISGGSERVKLHVETVRP